MLFMIGVKLLRHIYTRGDGGGGFTITIEFRRPCVPKVPEVNADIDWRRKRVYAAYLIYLLYN